MRGTGTASSGLATAKPQFLNNKVLVIHGIDKNVDHEKLQQVIDRQAGKHIDLLYIATLSKESSWCTTLAIELNDSDYDILSNLYFWERRIKIRAWVGFRPWRQRSRPIIQEVQNPMRDQWHL